MKNIDELEKALREGVASGLFTAGQATIWHRGQTATVSYGATHDQSNARQVHRDTLFDLASLTKVLCTTTVLARLCMRNEIDVDVPLPVILPDLPWHADFTNVRVRHVLSHCAGFEAWKDFYGQPRATVIGEIASNRPAYAPGTQTLYSDLGFIILGHALEVQTSLTLDALFQSEVSRPLNLHHLVFRPVESHRDPIEIVATGRSEKRPEFLQGVVNDDNASVFGGVAGHAGLFGTSEDCSAVAAAWIESFRNGGYLSKDIVRTFWNPQGRDPQNNFALGWSVASPQNSRGGTKISPNSVGHLGFTGTSIWIDVKQEAAVTLLTNRTYRPNTSERIQNFRQSFHDLVWERL